MKYKHDTDVIIGGIMVTISRFAEREVLHLRLVATIFYCPRHLRRNEYRPVRLKMNLHMRHTDHVKRQNIHFACCG